MMDNPLAGVKLEHWYMLLAPAGVGLAIAGAGFRSNALILIGLGLFFWGLGEMKNHPRRTHLFEGGGQIEDTRRRGSAFGWLLDAIGVALMLLGTYRLIAHG